METSAEISGVVVDREGRAVARATVRVESDGLEATWECDEDGRFLVRADEGETIWISAEPEGHAPAAACIVAPAHEVRIVVTPESVLVGRVIDRDGGEPIAGALVSVDRVSTMEIGRAEAVTDEEGRFRIRGLPPGQYEPMVSAEQWRGQGPSIELGYRETSDELVIEVARRPTVRGRVLLPGPLAQRGFVRMQNARGERRSGAIAEDGSFEVRAVDLGSWQVTVDATPYIEVAARELEISEDLNELVLPTKKGARLSGIVVDGEGNSVEHASVGLHLGAWSWPPASQEGGAFTYDGLRPGRYQLTASANGALGRASTGIDLAIGESDIEDLSLVLRARSAAGHHSEEDDTEVDNRASDFDIVVEDADRSIIGRVVDGTGLPFPGVCVAAARETDHDEEYEEALAVARNDEAVAVRTDELGRFEIDYLMEGLYSIVAYRPEGEELIATAVRTDRRITLMLDPAGTLEGRVIGATTFELCARRLPQFDRTETIVAQDGTWKIEGLAPGKWWVQIVAATASIALNAIVRPGRTTDLGAIPLEPFGVVRGRVIDPSGAPLAGADVIALSTHPRTIRGQTDGGGWYQISVPAGWVHVDVPYGHHGSTRGEVRAGETVELPPIQLT